MNTAPIIDLHELAKLPKSALIDALWAKQSTGERTTIRYSNEVMPVLRKWANKKQEHFIVVTLNGVHDLIRARCITKGLVNRTVVHPREVYRPAIRDNAAAIIVAHNHPSGSLNPSSEDIDITTRLQAAGQTIGIAMLDHIIFGETGYRSLKESDLF